MSDDIVTRLRNLADWYAPLARNANTSKALDDAANWIELYRDVIWHLWAHRHGCGRQDCALCTEAYRAFTEENERMLDDE
jgi:hypothetical protein